MPRMYHRIGIRYMTLTHNGGPTWAAPAVDFDGGFVEEKPMTGVIPDTRVYIGSNDT